jgi:hypothetical protein
VRKSAAGRELDKRTHDDQPAVGEKEMPPRRVRLGLIEGHREGGFV